MSGSPAFAEDNRLVPGDKPLVPGDQIQAYKIKNKNQEWEEEIYALLQEEGEDARPGPRGGEWSAAARQGPQENPGGYARGLLRPANDGIAGDLCEVVAVPESGLKALVAE